MVAFAHEPVLAQEVLHYLAPTPGGVYCDATVGGGGHARLILEASAPTGKLVGIDRDPAAVEAARARLLEFGDRVTLVHGRFGDVADILQALGIVPLSGIVIDLGVSSPQLDTAERGFSFAKEGPLDMRMDTSGGDTALDLVTHASVEDLARILRDYGEERYAQKIARAIKDAVRTGTVRTTGELRSVVVRAIPRASHERIDPATRTFQALRIAVNEELAELERFLEVFPDLLAPSGRCVIIAFHSLEDRPVKERLRELSWTSRLPADLAAAAGERTRPICRVLTKKPITASEEEIRRNPRARSAKLRACEKA